MSDPSPTLVDDLHDVVGLVRRRSRRITGPPLPGLDLSGAQLELVRVVRRSPGIGVADAAAALGLAPNTVSTLVGRLTALDVLVRERGLTDRRAASLQLTPTARAALEQWRDRRAQATRAALARLDETDRKLLEQALPVLARVAAALGPEPESRMGVAPADTSPDPAEAVAP